ncbi:hypothetical protein CEXT_599731 [Caerostris extrusa]|uniref:Uncharacterized protein n=1 Tax=Caerostris extrusa TaxID=172846 RepID=A0AAV4RK24_CAEEX|nr:hypothetical protein CEXT_599731 [Caerostris extrusa]
MGRPNEILIGLGVREDKKLNWGSLFACINQIKYFGRGLTSISVYEKENPLKYLIKELPEPIKKSSLNPPSAISENHRCLELDIDWTREFAKTRSSSGVLFSHVCAETLECLFAASPLVHLPLQISQWTENSPKISELIRKNYFHLLLYLIS